MHLHSKGMKLLTLIAERTKVNFCGTRVSFEQRKVINNNIINELVATGTRAFENIVKRELSQKISCFL